MGTPIVPTSGLQEQRTCLYGRVWRFFIGEEAMVSLMLRAEASRRYSITLYQRFMETSRWGLWDIHACTLSTEPPAAYPPVGHLPRSIFLAKNCASWFALSESSDYIHDITADFRDVSSFRSWAHLYRYISANQSVNPPSEKSICYTRRWNVSGEIV